LLESFPPKISKSLLKIQSGTGTHNLRLTKNEVLRLDMGKQTLKTIAKIYI